MTDPAHPQTTHTKAPLLILLVLMVCAFYPVQAASPDPAFANAELLPTPVPPARLIGGHRAVSLVNPPLIEPPPAPPEEPPLQLDFPPAEPIIDPGWRPPLYDVPWALNPHDHFYFQRPIDNDLIDWLWENYRYGDYFPNTEIVHTGIDIIADRGTPILAAAGGKVVWAGSGLSRDPTTEEDPYGLAVAILHDFGIDQRQIQTVYAHMDRVDVKIGDMVKPGDQIGIVGNTGFTTGPHLHFEVRIEEGDFYTTRNPELWLAPPQGWGVLAANLMKRDGTPFHNLEVRVRSLATDRFWTVRTYGPRSTNPDDYYGENLVLSDLPAGSYEVKFRYYWVSQTFTIDIHPGTVTYFAFRNSVGVTYDLPEDSKTSSRVIPEEIN